MVVSGVGSAATTLTLSDSPRSDLEFAIFPIKVLHRCVLLGGGGGDTCRLFFNALIQFK